MAKRESLMVKQVYGDTAFSLEAKSDESILIKDILIYNPASNYITCKTEKTTVGYFRVGGNLGNHLPLPIGSAKHSHGIKVAAADGALAEDHALIDAFGVSNANIAVFSDVSAATVEDNVLQFGAIPGIGYKSLLKYLTVLGIFKGFPVAEGETFSVSGAKQAGALAMVLYEKYDAGDIKSTDENGSAAGSYFFVNYGRTAAVITTSTSTAYDMTQSPAEFPDFPYGKTVPAKSKITLFGCCASDIVNDLGSNDTMNSDYLKFIRERVTLFDDDRNGLFMKGIIGTTDASAQIARGLSLVGNLSDVDIKPPFMFPDPLVFSEGEELNVYLTTTAGSSQASSDLAVADTEIGLIEKVEKV